MSIRITILKNMGILSLAEVLTNVISFILMVAISRFLGTVGLGKYSFAFAFVGIFAIVSDLGISTFSVRDVSRNKEKAQKYFSNYFSLKIFFAFTALILPILAISLTNEPLDVKLTVSLASFAMALNYMSYPFKFLFNAYEKFEYHALYLISERVIAVILGFFVLIKGYGLVPLVSTLILSNFASLLVATVIAKKRFVKLELDFDFKFWKFLVIGSLPFWLTIVFRTLYFRIDTVILSFIDNYAATGIYSAAYKLIDALVVIPMNLTLVLFPVMSRLFKESKESLKLLYEKTFYYLCILALPICFGVTLLAHRIISFIYKEQFSESAIALQILVWMSIFLFLNYLMGYLLNAINLQKVFTIITFAGAIINIMLNLILIPLYSFKGAAIATVITGFLSFILLYYFLTKNNFKVNLISTLSKPIFASMIMVFFLINFKNMHLLILVPLSAVVYFACLFATRAVNKEELDIIKNILKRIRINKK